MLARYMFARVGGPLREILFMLAKADAPMLQCGCKPRTWGGAAMAQRSSAVAVLALVKAFDRVSHSALVMAATVGVLTQGRHGFHQGPW